MTTRLIEWAMLAIANGGSILSFFFLMFSDSPRFIENLNTIQRIVFKDLYAIPFVVIICSLILCVIYFFWRSDYVSHVAGAVGFIGLIYLLIFYSAYL